MKRCMRPGCRNEARPKGDYCKPACRAAAFKLRKRYGGMLPLERRRLADRESKKAARASGVIPSDVRLSFRRAVEEVALFLQAREGGSLEEAHLDAEAILRAALPERLREIA